MAAIYGAPSAFRETFAIPQSPVIPSEHTMPKFRIIIEDERSGQEFKGYSGLSRIACERIIALIDSVGAHDLAAGKLPTGKNKGRVLSRFALDVAHVFDRKPPKQAQRNALNIKPRARTGR